jgi:dTDP-4-dehydrorhamnose 3,5-epimerase
MNITMLYFGYPPGFAQGFLALEEDTHLQYKTTALHNGNAEGAIHPLKSGLNIDWALPEKEILLSEKDKTAQTFEDYKSNPKF